MTPEDVRGLQHQISDALRDRASRIRNGNDLATVRKVLAEVQESAAEWLRQTGNPEARAARAAQAAQTVVNLLVHAKEDGGLDLSVNGAEGDGATIHLNRGGALRLTSALLEIAALRMRPDPSEASRDPQETVHLDGPGGAACADPSDEVTVSSSPGEVTCAACLAARAAEDAPGVHPIARWLARNVVLQDGISLAIAARVAEPRRPYLGESRLAYWTTLVEQARPAAGLVLALVAQHSERAAEILRLASEDPK